MATQIRGALIYYRADRKVDQITSNTVDVEVVQSLSSEKLFPKQPTELINIIMLASK